MKIDIPRIARLAYLHIGAEELPQFEKDMEAIVEMVQNLPELTDSLTPHTNTPMELRADIPEDKKYSREELLVNAPDIESGCFAVPKTVEQEAQG